MPLGSTSHRYRRCSVSNVLILPAGDRRRLTHDFLSSFFRSQALTTHSDCSNHTSISISGAQADSELSRSSKLSATNELREADPFPSLPSSSCTTFSLTVSTGLSSSRIVRGYVLPCLALRPCSRQPIPSVFPDVSRSSRSAISFSAYMAFVPVLPDHVNLLYDTTLGFYAPTGVLVGLYLDARVGFLFLQALHISPSTKGVRWLGQSSCR